MRLLTRKRESLSARGPKESRRHVVRFRHVWCDEQAKLEEMGFDLSRGLRHASHDSDSDSTKHGRAGGRAGGGI